MKSTDTAVLDKNFLEIAQELGRVSLKSGGTIEQALTVSSSAHITGNASVVGTLRVEDDTTIVATVTASAFRLSCPSAFTELTAAGRTLGCLQTAEEGSGTWSVAIDDCFDTYGGTLPPPQIWCIGALNYPLTDEDDDFEWSGDPDDATNGVILQGDAGDCNPGVTALGNTVAYRCWIPR